MKEGWYCASEGNYCPFLSCLDNYENRRNCKALHRKYPTPEEYKNEYNRDYPDNNAVYVYYRYTLTDWRCAIRTYRDAKNTANLMKIICACTPFPIDEFESRGAK
ncbi:hypothetical protein FACS1894137_14100 [Spirochaetia bacterium]|nr:hypothetical protein FACS1894137_14100 [Spirochaetia bacterium]